MNPDSDLTEEDLAVVRVPLWRKAAIVLALLVGVGVIIFLSVAKDSAEREKEEQLENIRLDPIEQP